MNRTLTIITIAAAIACAACHRSDKTTAEGVEAVDVAYPLVDSVTLFKTYPGTLTAKNEVKLVARVNGYLESKNYQSGDFVRKGTVLFTIESGNYSDAVERARSAVNTAEAELEYASTRYTALSEALKSDAVSRMEVEQGLSNLEQAKANLRSSKAALETALTQLSYCTVRAPFDGHVSTNLCDVGSFVGGEASPVPLATIYEDDVMTANFSIDDAHALNELASNMKANGGEYNSIPVSFTDTLAHDYTASLNYLAPEVSSSTGTLPLKASIDNPYGELRSGMFVSVDLPLGDAPHAILVKDASISTDQLGKYLYVVNDSNRVVYTPVTAGPLVRDSLRIIEKGISPTDRYVTKALLKVRDGMTVKPIIVK